LHNQTLSSQAHWLVARKADIRPKPAKELAYPNARKEKQCSKNERKITGKMNNETLTKCICHKGFSGYSSVATRSNFRVG